MKRAIIIFISALLLASAASSQIPESINYQGVLTDGAGTVVADGSYELTLSLYTVSTGGSPVWSCAETVTVTKGIFNAVLGNSCVLDVDFSEQYYLGISVEGGAELTPRTPMTSAAYSMSSLSVNGVDNLFPSTGNVGIGTDSPTHRLTIHNDSQVGLRYNGYDGSWASIYVNGASGGKPNYGYMRNNALIASHHLDSSNIWQLRFAPNNVFSVSSTGHAGVGSGVAPGAEILTVGGAVTLGNSAANTTGTLRWTGSDFEGYNGSAWQSLTGGGGSLPAGTADQTLRHDGSIWAASDLLRNDGTTVNIGSDTQDGILHMYQNGSVDPVIELLRDTPDGGALFVYDSAGNPIASINNDLNGEGGYMYIARSTSHPGFSVDGNYNGSNSTVVDIVGEASAMRFNTDVSGKASVVLPADAINSEEVLNEPGVASNGEDNNTIIGTDPTTILSRSITVPAPGYVLVMAAAQVTIVHTYGAYSRAVFGVSTSSSSLPNNQDLMLGFPDDEESGYYYIPVSPHGLFQVGSAGTYTYYFLGDQHDAEADFRAWDPQLTLVYIPTSYGTVTSTLASGGSASEETASASPGKTQAEIEAEKAESIADNNARIQRELDRMRSEIEKLKREMEKDEDQMKR
ncbi:MAG: hypothetical protein GF417_09200 [Candidatus Latescibacteria bacterium]|nr:hypothetical protein [bacterium]MBD3424600.1 hypothetical protein [Candidatus Latescibacterota bacterium]